MPCHNGVLHRACGECSTGVQAATRHDAPLKADRVLQTFEQFAVSVALLGGQIEGGSVIDLVRLGRILTRARSCSINIGG